MYGLLAAGYNGSMRRVREEAFGGTKTSHTTYTDIQKLLEQSSLLENVSDNKETYTYVMKFAFVWNYLKENYPDQFDVPPKPPVQNKVLKK